MFGYLGLDKDHVVDKVVVLMKVNLSLLVLYFLKLFPHSKQLMQDHVKNVRYPYLMFARLTGTILLLRGI